MRYLILLLLIGCSITPEQIEYANKLCSLNGGVEFYETTSISNVVDVKCKNEAYFLVIMTKE